MSETAKGLLRPWLGVLLLSIGQVAQAAPQRELPAKPEETLLTRWRLPLVRQGLDRQVIESQATPLVDARRGQIVCGTGEGRVVALDANTARERWRHQGVAPFESTPRLFVRPAAGGAAAVGVALGAKDGGVVALNANTGQLWWRTELDGDVRAAPAAARHTLYVTTQRNRLAALAADDGRVLWSFERPPPAGMTVLGHAGALVRGNRLWTSFADGMAVAFAADTGDVLWQRPLSLAGGRFRDADATPVAAGRGIAFASLSDGVYLLDGEDGRTLWQRPMENVAQLAVGHGNAGRGAASRLFAGDGDGQVAALSAASGQVLWRRKLEDTPIRCLVAWQDKLLVLANEQGVRVLSQQEGRLLETVSLGGRPGGGLGVSGRMAAHVTGQGALLSWALLPSTTR